MEKANKEFQKYPTDKRKWDRNYLKIFGIKCPKCKGTGMIPGGQCDDYCRFCNGIGYVEKNKGLGL